MMLPARDIPEEDASRTGFEGAAGTPARAPSPAGTRQPTGEAMDGGQLTDADEAMEADQAAGADAEVVVVTADADVVAYDPAAASASPADTASPAGAGSSTEADTPVGAGAAAGAGPSVDAAAGNQWSDILAMFVDDPRGSVAEASVMANEAIEAFIAAARDRQASLSASWQAPDADTERLRVALQDYRALWSSVTQLRQPA
jgi:hypothetical protein